MPHIRQDRHGTVLIPGDEVTVRFVVQPAPPGMAGCDLSLRALDVGHTGQSYLPWLTCPSKLAEKFDAVPMKRYILEPDGRTIHVDVPKDTSITIGRFYR